MKTIFLFAVLTLASTAFAGGTAVVDVRDFNATATYQKEGNHVTGSAFNFGPYGQGTIQYQTTENGGWNGRFGMTSIRFHSAETRPNGDIRVQFSTVPGGYYSYILSRDDQGNRTLRGTNWHHNLVSATVDKEDDSFRFSNNQTSFELPGKEGTYEGYATVRRGWESYTTWAKVAGNEELAIQTLVEADPLLFVLVYVLPFDL